MFYFASVISNFPTHFFQLYAIFAYRCYNALYNMYMHGQIAAARCGAPV